MGTSALKIEVILAAILIFFLTTGGSAVIILFLRKYLGAVEEQVKKINGSIEGMTKKHDDCHDTLPDRFAALKEFEEYRRVVDGMVGKLFNRMDIVCEGVAFLKGALNPEDIKRGKRRAISDGRPRGGKGRKNKPKEAAV